MQSGTTSYSNLKKHGFRGNLAWVHNEEGSGAKFWNCSVYYPDDPYNIKTNSGVTVDPGVDLGHAPEYLIRNVFNYYNNAGHLGIRGMARLMNAVGKRREEAVQWMKSNIHMFEGIFKVDDKDAMYVMDMYTAPAYWLPLTKHMPRLAAIKEDYMASAVHTALLSMSYNRGAITTVNLAKSFVDVGDFGGLAFAIKMVKQATQSLRDRRKREANLIIDAIQFKENFEMTVKELNPMPLTAIPLMEREVLLMEYVPVPPKPGITHI